MEVLSKEKEVQQLMQSVTSSEINEDEKIPTMAQSMGIKFEKTPAYAAVHDEVNTSLGVTPKSTGKLSKMRSCFDASRVRRSSVVLSKAEIDQLLNDVMSSEIDETIPTMAQSIGIKLSKNPTYGEVVNKVKAQQTQPDREM